MLVSFDFIDIFGQLTYLGVKYLLLLRLWNYIRGYVIILVEGYFLEKFMNICTHRQILLWDIKRQKNCILILKVSIKGFKLLRPVARKTKCRVRIVKKKGLPFLFNRYRKRKTFFAGAVLFVLLVYFMTSFIWSVEITGNEELETKYIEGVLSGFGVKPGVLKYSIDTKKAVSDMMLGLEELSWISIDVKGTKVKVQLRERIIPPELVPKDKPCDIIAAKDGFINQIIVRDGIEAVAVGETVRKGQVLISGSIPVKNEKDRFRLVHAMGTVKARTWYEVECPVILEVEERSRTGREYVDYSVILFTKKIDLFHKKDKYETNDYEEKNRMLSIGENMVFPFELIEKKYSEVELYTVRVDEEDARKQAEENAHKGIMDLKPEAAEVIKTDLKYIDDELEGLKVKLTVECLEDIGITKEIGGK